MVPEHIRRWFLPTYSLCGVVVVSVSLIWLAVDRESLEPHLSEHTLIESVTALLALATCVVALIVACRVENKKRWLVLAALGLFTAGEEVTWGQGLLWEGYTHVLGLYVDNAHDFFDVFLKSIVIFVDEARTTVWFLLFIAGFAAGVTLTVQWVSRVSRRDLVGLWSRPVQFVVIAVCVAFLSQLVDTRALDWIEMTELTRRAIEEPLELMSALALLLAALSADVTPPPPISTVEAVAEDPAEER